MRTAQTFVPMTAGRPDGVYALDGDGVVWRTRGGAYGWNRVPANFRGVRMLPPEVTPEDETGRVAVEDMAGVVHRWTRGGWDTP